MKRTVRDNICLFLALIIVISLLPILHFETSASTNGHTQAEAVQWAKSMADQHWSISDGSGETQCVEFIQQYYKYLVGYQVSGHAYHYLTDTYGACPSGWTRPDKSTARPGDIVVWDSWAYFREDHSDYAGEHGHIGIIISVSGNTMVTVEAHAGENYGSERGVCGYKYNREVSCISGLIRPDFVNSTYHGSEMTSGAGKTLLDGDYEIICTADTTYQLDVVGTTIPAANGANVRIYQRNATPRSKDIFTVTYLNNGFYKIIQKGTNMSLDVDCASTAEGANIKVMPYVGNTAQQYSISRTSIGGINKTYNIQAKCSGLALDVSGTFKNMANVQQWRQNNTNAQGWLFIPCQPEQPLENGRYILLSAMDTNYELDVAGNSASISSGTNVRVWKDTGCQSRYNSFDITKLSNGYYKIINSASGLALGVPGGGSVFSQNVAVITASDDDAQRWAITKYENGYILRVRSCGYALDAESNTTLSNGTNVSQHPVHGNNNQIWKFVNAEYTVNYKANGGSGAPAAQTKYYKADLTISSTKPKRTGYTFDGWNTSSTATLSSYQPGDKYKKDADLNLYAVWNPNKYTVTFNPNGGGSVSYADMGVVYDQTYGTLPTTSRIGYKFDGWYTAASGGTKVTNNTKVTTASDHTLYAHWTANRYTVTFNPNGGTVSQTSKYVTYDQKYGDLPAPTKTCYTFAGWYTAKSGGTKVTKDTKVTTASNHTLYAHWNSISVTGVTVSPATLEMKLYETATLKATVAPSNATNQAITWSSSNPSVASVDANGNVTAMANGTATITATAKDGSGKTGSCAVTVKSLYLIDINGQLDGVDSGNIRNYGTFDVYINGDKVREDYDDFCMSYPKGTVYEIKDIKPAAGCVYNGVVEGSLSGTVGEKNVYIRLSFSTAPEPDPFRFDDVKDPKAYYFDAVYWAYNHTPYQVTAGIDATHFGPNQTVTRAQAMTFFWAAKDRPKFKKASTQFVDVKKTDWYYKSVMWAVENGITAGTDATHFSPNKTCNRGEILAFLYAAMKKPKVKIKNPYKDVTNQWYKKAALWAYEQRIEKGEKGKFNASTPCTRASTVTYLYRFLERKSLLD